MNKLCQLKETGQNLKGVNNLTFWEKKGWTTGYLGEMLKNSRWTTNKKGNLQLQMINEWTNSGNNTWNVEWKFRKQLPCPNCDLNFEFLIF